MTCGSHIVLENSLGACSRLSTGQANNPTPFARPTHPRLLHYNSLLPVIPSFHITPVQLLLTLLQNPWPPKYPWSPLSTRLDITRHEFIVIYTSGSAMVKAYLARFLCMFNSSKDEWVAGLDVEYTTVLEREKILKEAEKKKPVMIQVCIYNMCLV